MLLRSRSHFWRWLLLSLGGGLISSTFLLFLLLMIGASVVMGLVATAAKPIVSSFENVACTLTGEGTCKRHASALGDAVAQQAQELQQHLTGVRANVYHPDDPFMKPVYTYWVQEICGGTPCPVVESGSLQCVSFVRAAYHLAGYELPAWGNAVDFWTLYQSRLDWRVLSLQDVVFPQERAYPAAGDIVVWDGGTDHLGHVAIVTDVHVAPDGSFSLTVGQANAPGNSFNEAHRADAGNFYTMYAGPERIPHTWNGYRVLGYLRFQGSEQQARAATTIVERPTAFSQEGGSW